MESRHKLTLTATIIAVIFALLVYLVPNLASLWFTIEVIVLPALYIVGYEIIMEKQKRNFDRTILSLERIIGNINRDMLELKNKHQKN